MPVTEADFVSTLKDKIGATHVDVSDTSGGCGQSFELVVVAAAFEGKTVLQRHRLVNDACKDLVSQVHAFSQKCLTPAQFEATHKA
ncbi:bola-like protein [Gonapodya prolifera JEL478]|uniref:Bola-like protein n=1 Tax=Gonapodya prolifera (strain JEL478) TaxID=1344416 RepID=A0A139AUW0_GONPJ|nr:bola-like protein [Gonapodya prolifera JEL478]|eukprot:KXS20497.1 bola-like protein [Gonapodya prolifera JEL478]